VRWDTDEKNVLYFISENNLYRLDIEKTESAIKIAEHVSDYDLSGSKIYVFRNDSGIIYRLSNGNFSDARQITTSPPEDMTDPNYRIIVYDEKRIAIINDRTKKLYIFNSGELDDYFRELAREVEDVQFSNDGKKLLFWSSRELFVYFTRKWDVQPVRAENELMNITRYSQPIRNIQWIKDYEHIIFSVGSELKVIELDHRDRHIGMDIMTGLSSDVEVVADIANDRLYISRPAEKRFDSIDFPESTGFFGT
jgi:WD40 repeat protein